MNTKLYMIFMACFMFGVSCVGYSSASASETKGLDFSYIPQTLQNHKPNLKLHKIQNAKQLMNLLKSKGLWEFKSNEVDLLLVKNFPRDFKKLSVRNKKRAFFHSMIPMILLASKEIAMERQAVITLSKKYASVKQYTSETIRLFNSNEQAFIQRMVKKYKSSYRKELLKRIDTLPISLVLAQTAIESAWGTSRFSVEGNNLFGMWSFNGKGLIPKYRKKGLKHRVAIYPSLLDSVRDYMLKINTVRAYNKLRNIRVYTKNSIKLTQGLLHYSQRKHLYIKDLQKMIHKNRLRKYDTLQLKTNKI